MDQTYDNSSLRIGYILIEDRGQEGYIGGLLCTNERGAPLEFWHTAHTPIKADRMQQLLYGKTLKPELFGRNILGSLLREDSETPRQKPTLLLTTEEAVFRGADTSGIPIFHVIKIDENAGKWVQVGYKQVRTATAELLLGCRLQEEDMATVIIPKLEGIDIVEPFQRVQALLNEIASGGSESSGE